MVAVMPDPIVSNAVATCVWPTVRSRRDDARPALAQNRQRAGTGGAASERGVARALVGSGPLVYAAIRSRHRSDRARPLLVPESR